MIRPHLGASRKIHPGQKIHSSLILSDKTHVEYTPKAHPLDSDPDFWEKARTEGLGDWLELDLYQHTYDLVKRLITESSGTVLQTLRQTAMSGMSAHFFRFPLVYTRPLSADGLQAVYDGVIRVLGSDNFESEVKCHFLQSAVEIVGRRVRESTSLKLGDYKEICALVSDVLESNPKLGQQFLGQFTNSERKNSYFPRRGTESLPRFDVCSGGTHQFH